MTIVGKYIITPEIFEELKKIQSAQKGEIRIAYALQNYLQRKNQSIFGYEFEGTRYDCGSKAGFLRAVVDYGLKHRETKKEFKKYLKTLKF